MTGLLDYHPLLLESDGAGSDSNQRKGGEIIRGSGTVKTPSESLNSQILVRTTDCKI